MTTRRKIGICLVSPLVAVILVQMIHDLGFFGSLILISVLTATVGGAWLIINGGDDD